MAVAAGIAFVWLWKGRKRAPLWQLNSWSKSKRCCYNGLVISLYPASRAIWQKKIRKKKFIPIHLFSMSRWEFFFFFNLNFIFVLPKQPTENHNMKSLFSTVTFKSIYSSLENIYAQY